MQVLSEVVRHEGWRPQLVREAAAKKIKGQCSAILHTTWVLIATVSMSVTRLQCNRASSRLCAGICGFMSLYIGCVRR